MAASVEDLDLEKTWKFCSVLQPRRRCLSEGAETTGIGTRLARITGHSEKELKAGLMLKYPAGVSNLQCIILIP